MICTKCNQIMEFEDPALEKLQVKIALSHGFHMLQHRMEIYGICGRCLKTRDRRIPLVRAKAGETVTIKEINGGSGARMRLMAMGLRVGDQLRVLTNINAQQIAVAIDYNRFVLGRGLAGKIVVEPVAMEADQSPEPQLGS
jgi:Fur family ferric uptake transcriptional regulator